jgi:hypothetical protein
MTREPRSHADVAALIQAQRFLAATTVVRALRDPVSMVQLQQQIASSGEGLQETLDRIVEHALRLTGAEGAAIVFDEGNDLVYRAVAGTVPGQLVGAVLVFASRACAFAGPMSAI